VSLAELVRHVVVEQARLAEAKNVDLGVTQSDETAVVSGDRDALRILLSNLVSNALRYTPDGGRVDVSCGLDRLSHSDSANKARSLGGSRKASAAI